VLDTLILIFLANFPINLSQFVDKNKMNKNYILCFITSNQFGGINLLCGVL
jgi:hypothetical protein